MKKINRQSGFCLLKGENFTWDMHFRIIAKNRNEHILKEIQTGFLLLLFFIGGCATYQPMPLSVEAVRDGLKPPEMIQIQELAKNIKHPILQPVDLNANEGLSPDGAAILAVLLNPLLRSIRDQRALSQAQLFEAGLLPNPELSTSFEVPTGGDKTGRVNAFGLGLNWSLTSLITRSSRVKEAKGQSAAVDLDIAWREWQVAQGAKAAAYQLSCLQNQAALFENADRRMQERLGLVQQAVNSGSMTLIELNTVKVAKSRINQRFLELEKQVGQQKLSLLRLIGLPSDSEVQLNNRIHSPSNILLSKVSLINGLEQRRLDLLALRRGYDSQEAAVRVAILSQFPRITIGPLINRDTDKVQTTGIGLTIELPILNRNQGKIAVERATRKKLYDEYMARVFEARSDVEQLISSIYFLNNQIAAAQITETNLRELAENHQQALQEGRVSVLAYNHLQNDLLEIQVKLVDLKGQLAQAEVALELATGYFRIPAQDEGPKALATESGVEKEQ